MPMPVKENTRKLYNDVKNDFSSLQSVREHGVQKYTTKYLVRKLAAKYYKSPTTIENIIYGRI